MYLNMVLNMVLVEAARIGDAANVNVLLRRNIDINFRDTNGLTILHYATKNGNREMVTLVLDRGADIEIRTFDGLTALHYATKDGLDDVAECLLKYNANVNALDRNGCTPLHYANAIKSKNVLRTMIARTRNVNQRCHKGTRPIEAAVESCNECMVELLVDSKADVHAKNDRTGLSLLWFGCDSSNVPIIKSLLKGGANPCAVEANGLTVLNHVLETSTPEIIQLMLDHGAPLDTKTSRGHNVLHSAVLNKHLCVVEMLVNRGANFMAHTISGSSVLKMALSSKHVPNSYDIVEYLLWKGVRLNADLDWSVMSRPFADFEKKEFVVVKHMALREYTNQLFPQHRSSIQLNIDLLKFFMECNAEIAKLQEIKVNDGGSLLDVLLTTEPDRILDYVEGCDITDAFDPCKFPVYSSTFSAIFTKNLNNIMTVRNTQEYLRLTLNLNSTRHLVIEKILSFLSIDDLNNFRPESTIPTYYSYKNTSSGRQSHIS